MRRFGLSAWPIAFLACCALSAKPQVNGASGTTQSIQVNDRRPLAAALQELEKRQGLAITYEDPVYSNPADIQDVTPARANRPGAKAHRVMVPKKGSFRFDYSVENGQTVENGRALIQRMLSQYSASATATFGVYERATKNGSEWHVFPTQVRDANGVSEKTPALFDHIIYIPVGKRTFNDMFREILAQVSEVSGYKVVLGYFPMNYFSAWQDHIDSYGVENRSARDALAELLGPSFVWYLYNVPGEKKFFLDVHIKAAPTAALAPQRFSPLDKSGHLSNAPRVSRAEAYQHVSPAMLRHYAWSKGRITEVQLALARQGFYDSKPTGKWDARTISAMHQFQLSNGLAATGSLDKASVEKLAVDLTATPINPAPSEKP